MEILIAAIVALLSQGIKKLESRVGGNVTLIVVFILCFAGTALYQYISIAHVDIIQSFTATFLSAIGIYEVALKKIPYIGKDK